MTGAPLFDPGAVVATPGALVILALGATFLGLGRITTWETVRRIAAKTALVTVLAVVAAPVLASLVSEAVAAAVGLAEQLWAPVVGLAEAADATPSELAKVLVLSASLLLASRWGTKKRRRGRRR